MSLLITHPTCEIELSLVNNDSCTQVLACLDGYMNIALEQTEEYANGQVGNNKNGHWMFFLVAMLDIPETFIL